MFPMRSFIVYFITCLLSLHFTSSVYGLAVMSVDLGSESLKIAIVSPGKPMEIILNLDSQRKTPLAVAFRDGDRFFGEEAIATGARFPEKVFAYLLDLIGKEFDNPLIKLYQKRFPFVKLSKDPYKSTVLLHHPEELIFTPEELMAMLLEKAKSYAELSAGDKQTIKDVVITVPPYFTQAERRSLLCSARMAGLKVLQLINSNTAVALNYGVFRRKDFNESVPSYVLFYEMGSSSTVATVASYQLVKTKEKGFVETNPQLTIKGVGFDRTLGGLEMQIRLSDYLAKRFSNQSKKKLENIMSNKRAMSKFFKEAARVKKVLSANTEHYAQIENVMEDIDFKELIKRSEFEELCSDLFGQRLINPIIQALTSSGITLNEIDQIILFGGNTRIPKIQQVLMESLKVNDLAKSVNADEAAALGAAYQAAYLSKGFKVKTFLIKEANLFPIQVDFTRIVDQDDGSTKQKVIHKMLFSRNNLYPQKKVLTFSRHISDFDFNINYADLEEILDPKEISYMGSLNISNVKVKGVSAILAKHNEENKESKGIKAYFRMTESGILVLETVEATYEAKLQEVQQEEQGNVVRDAFVKFGDTLSNLFGGSKDENITDSTSNSTNVTQTTFAEKEKINQGLNVTNITLDDKSKTSTKIVIKTIKEPFDIDVHELDLASYTEAEIEQSIKRLAEIGAKERAKHERDAIKNALESFIIEFKMKLYENEFEEASTENEREAIVKHFTSVSEWLENESNDAETEVFEDKLRSLKLSIKEVVERVVEHRERPEAIKSLKEFLNISKIFYDGAVNVSSSEQIFTEIELSTLEQLIATTQEWLDTSMLEQSKIPLDQNPKLLVKNIREKIGLLDREVKYLINKARITLPKKDDSESQTTKQDKKVEEEISETPLEIDDGTVQKEEIKHSQGDKTSETIHTEL